MNGRAAYPALHWTDMGRQAPLRPFAALLLYFLAPAYYLLLRHRAVASAAVACSNCGLPRDAYVVLCAWPLGSDGLAWVAAGTLLDAPISW